MLFPTSLAFKEVQTNLSSVKSWTFWMFYIWNDSPMGKSGRIVDEALSIILKGHGDLNAEWSVAGNWEHGAHVLKAWFLFSKMFYTAKRIKNTPKTKWPNEKQ